MTDTAMTSATTAVSNASKLNKADRPAEALATLRTAMRRLAFSPEDLYTAGKTVRASIARSPLEMRVLRILLLGQCTTSWLKYALTAVAWSQGQLLDITEGPYDQVIQTLLAPTSGSPAVRPDVVVLLPWAADRLDGISDAPEQIENEVSLWLQAQSQVKVQFGSRVVQVGYDYSGYGAGGAGFSGTSAGNIGRVRSINAELRRYLPAGAYFVDLEQVSGGMGRESFYSPRRYHWTKQPFSEAGVIRLAECLWAGIRATTTGPKKLLVLDLDNTLWGGVVGETGPHGVTLGDGADGEAFKAFQAYIKGLNARGILLAVASKNNAADAREPFNVNREMLLSLDHFAAFEASWEPKSITIARIAKTLNLGLDSFVFFDDNPVERAEVEHELPEVTVVDVPPDPADYVRALQAGHWFETTELTDVDRTRAEQYAVERSRRELQESAGSIDTYLQSLDLRAEIDAIQEPDFPRVVQLLSKTNQFNVTTRRHTVDDLVGIVQTAGSISISMRATDRFGDYGLVAVMLGVPLQEHPDTILIDSWLMSCRVIGRTFEQFMFGAFVKRALELGYKQLRGEYIPTAKNELVKELYSVVGCTRIDSSGAGCVCYTLDLTGYALPSTWVKAAGYTGSDYGV